MKYQGTLDFKHPLPCNNLCSVSSQTKPKKKIKGEVKMKVEDKEVNLDSSGNENNALSFKPNRYIYWLKIVENISKTIQFFKFSGGHETRPPSRMGFWPLI